MEDQVRQLNDIDIGIPAFAYHRRRGRGVHATGPEWNFVLVYGSPECLLSTESWKSRLLILNGFKKMLIGVTFEAHCITQWYVAEFVAC